MVLAALLDLGVPRDVIDAALNKLGLGDQLIVTRVVKGGISAVDVQVRAEVDSNKHPTDHHHHHYRDIRTRISKAGLDTGIERRTQDMFRRLAQAEAKLHGTTIDSVAFHEVGAIDALVDIVGCAAALDWLDPRSVSSMSVAMGHGTVVCAHGVLPVPSPAALEILSDVGATVTNGGVERELCTPTGAAILASTVEQWAPPPTQIPVAIGYGAGNADLQDRPNVIRLIVGDSQPVEDSADVATSSMFRIEANIDDMNPELCEYVAEQLFAIGAVDVWWTAVSMKKSRPALLLSALVPERALRDAARVIVTETSSIGVRFDSVSRTELARSSVLVQTEFGPLPIKIAWLDGEIVNAAPEYGPCRSAAQKRKVSLKRVFDAVRVGFAQQRSPQPVESAVDGAC